MKTDTPTTETDAVAFYARQCFRPLEHVVPIDHARKLERQRDALLSACSAALYDFEEFVSVLVDRCRVHPFTNTENALRQAIAAVKGEQS